MNETVKKDLINAAKNAIKILKRGDYFELKELSNHTIHNASIFQDQYSISNAVIMYSLSKVLERGNLDGKKYIKLLENGINFLKRDDVASYKAITKKILQHISKSDLKLKMYIEKVIRQAEIKKGTKLYDHGISIGQAASVLGISQWELMNYVGKTQITDHSKPPDIKEKIQFTRGLFE
ncbi:MAG: hypothetical protein MAG795_01109 [Candidatus Woesearchaeota archaeon]|nr:hypothetical protein [Candidatus Woesearchaeota archaeon]